MPPPDDAAPDRAHQPKLHTGLSRMWHATGYSLAGLRAAWGEMAFRQEVLAAIVLLPAAFWVGNGWVEIALLAGSVVLVLIVELLNSAIEAAVDRIGLERHPLAKRAKDIGSAAVMLALLLAGGIWIGALLQRISFP